MTRRESSPGPSKAAKGRSGQSRQSSPCTSRGVATEERQDRKDQSSPDKFRFECPPPSITRSCISEERPVRSRQFVVQKILPPSIMRCCNIGKTSPVQTIAIQKVLSPSITSSCNIGKTSLVQTSSVLNVLPVHHEELHQRKDQSGPDNLPFRKFFPHPS
ncbi:hypothetical protein TNCV_3137981 [Trichonephila clavipes]|nr:hypothetical protein TNCV_3137981 [Trichonephila clavipes]